MVCPARAAGAVGAAETQNHRKQVQVGSEHTEQGQRDDTLVGSSSIHSRPKKSILKRADKNQTRTEGPIRIAVDACMRRGRGPGQGFKNQTTHREKPAGTDAQGRTLKEVWVGGTKHLVVDLTRTRIGRIQSINQLSIIRKEKGVRKGGCLWYY